MFSNPSNWSASPETWDPYGLDYGGAQSRLFVKARIVAGDHFETGIHTEMVIDAFPEYGFREEKEVLSAVLKANGLMFEREKRRENYLLSTDITLDRRLRAEFLERVREILG